MPPYSTVYSFYRRAQKSGLWDKILEHLVKVIRQKSGRNVDPSYAIIDSQSVKTTSSAQERGIDGEKIKGYKSHIVTDTMGNLLAIELHAANIHDTHAGIFVAKPSYERYPSIQKFCADAGYRGTFLQKAQELLLLNVDIFEKIKPHQWQKLPWKWVVERTIWLVQPFSPP